MFWCVMCEQVEYGNVVVGIEDKDSLMESRSVNTGRGQLQKLANRVFAVQTTRASMVAMLMSCRHLELWVLRQDLSFVSSGPQKLSMDAASPGLQLLFRVLSASPHLLGYFPPALPAEFELDGRRFHSFERLTPWGPAEATDEMATSVDILLGRVPGDQRAGRQVFAARTSIGGVPAEDAVVKLYDGARREVCNGAAAVAIASNLHVL